MNASLLVAIMYSTILVMSIGTLLGAMAKWIEGGLSSAPAGLRGWLLVMVLIHCSLFWQTTVLFGVEQFSFYSFVATIFGPVVLFWATCALVSALDKAQQPEGQAWLLARQRFYLLLVVSVLWLVAITSFMAAYTWQILVADMAILSIVLVLMAVKKASVHVASQWLVAALIVLSPSL